MQILKKSFQVQQIHYEKGHFVYLKLYGQRYASIVLNVGWIDDIDSILPEAGVVVGSGTENYGEVIKVSPLRDTDNYFIRDQIKDITEMLEPMPVQKGEKWQNRVWGDTVLVDNLVFDDRYKRPAIIYHSFISNSRNTESKVLEDFLLQFAQINEDENN